MIGELTIIFVVIKIKKVFALQGPAVQSSAITRVLLECCNEPIYTCPLFRFQSSGSAVDSTPGWNRISIHSDFDQHPIINRDCEYCSTVLTGRYHLTSSHTLSRLRSHLKLTDVIMPGGHRKQPFSHKQKKEQLKAKRERQQGQVHRARNYSDSGDADQDQSSIVSNAGNDQTGEFSAFESRPAAGRGQPGRYALMFRAETRDQIEAMKKDARKAIVPVQEEYLECKVEDFFPPELDFPVRPPWNYELSFEELENNEKKYFHEYLKKIDEMFDKTELSYFELNLETWRQFWRVLEMSDILLCVVDIRFPALLFPPSLYDYVSGKMKKSLILVLNKIDLAPAPLVVAWKEYFKARFPEVEILCFTSFPSYNLHGNRSDKSMKGNKKKAKPKMAAEGALEVYKACEKIVAGEVDLTKWKEKIMEEMNISEMDEDEGIEIGSGDNAKPDVSYFEFKKFNDGIVTIGCVGQPNVGKSSLINALMGKKVVSVSKTPGHTKHFQTIFLTQNVRLCDCPGLIFPSRVPKSLQVLCGSYPIAQLREPYSTVKYLGERIDLPSVLRITHPEGDTEWSAFDIADGWAAKRGYYTAKASRLDSYRGANHILRLALEGRICLCLRPPNYLKDKDKWETHPSVAEIQLIQAKFSSENPSPTWTPAKFDSDVSDTEDDNETAVVGKNKLYPSAGRQSVSHGGSDADDNTSSEEEIPTTKKTTHTKGKKLAMQNKFALLLNDD
ncbi:unnamed protein product [Allacma fusca]|uniref:CP-type G domain-containing protein n=1 Tax=Allacma fusca TaxID=39272 RepID=A0A8J2PJ61_9HEXA|nr:unnamed protein product [Allacma fusca]